MAGVVVLDCFGWREPASLRLFKIRAVLLLRSVAIIVFKNIPMLSCADCHAPFAYADAIHACYAPQQCRHEHCSLVNQLAESIAAARESRVACEYLIFVSETSQHSFSFNLSANVEKIATLRDSLAVHMPAVMVLTSASRCESTPETQLPLNSQSITGLAVHTSIADSIISSDVWGNDHMTASPLPLASGLFITGSGCWSSPSLYSSQADVRSLYDRVLSTVHAWDALISSPHTLYPPYSLPPQLRLSRLDASDSPLQRLRIVILAYSNNTETIQRCIFSVISAQYDSMYHVSVDVRALTAVAISALMPIAATLRPPDGLSLQFTKNLLETTVPVTSTVVISAFLASSTASHTLLLDESVQVGC